MQETRCLERPGDDSSAFAVLFVLNALWSRQVRGKEQKMFVSFTYVYFFPSCSVSCLCTKEIKLLSFRAQKSVLIFTCPRVETAPNFLEPPSRLPQSLTPELPPNLRRTSVGLHGAPQLPHVLSSSGI
jgi:hypothetical protein